MTVWLIFAMQQPFIFSGIKYVYSDMGIDMGHVHVHMHGYVHSYIDL